MTDHQDVVEACKAVLVHNDKKLFTLPAEGLYPHQWLWDSCFVAIGLRHIDIDRAQTELTSLLRGQWSNGMLPHMIFDDALLYTQDRNIWRSQLSVYAPDDISTSGITQPPVLAEAVLQVGQKLSKAEQRSWYQTMLPALVKYHQWLYRERDANANGLVFQVHPYETGLDSTPPWIDQLHRHHKPWWAVVLQKSHIINAVSLFRRDTRHVPPGQRMDNLDALLYYDVLRKLRAKRYDVRRATRRNTFVIQDLSYNSIFVRANECLREIAKVAAYDLPPELLHSMQATTASFEQFWDGYSAQYYSRNQKTGKLIRVPSIATLLPLYAGHITKERASQLVRLLHNRNVFGSEYPVASVPLNSSYFNAMRYWQGPTWINTNWMIVQGLLRYGYKKEAEIIRLKSLQLVHEHGPYEYYSPLDGTPAGAQNFSWTAALAIDLAAASPPKASH